MLPNNNNTFNPFLCNSLYSSWSFFSMSGCLGVLMNLTLMLFFSDPPHDRPWVQGKPFTCPVHVITIISVELHHFQLLFPNVTVSLRDRNFLFQYLLHIFSHRKIRVWTSPLSSVQPTTDIDKWGGNARKNLGAQTRVIDRRSARADLLCARASRYNLRTTVMFTSATIKLRAVQYAATHNVGTPTPFSHYIIIIIGPYLGGPDLGTGQQFF